MWGVVSGFWSDWHELVEKDAGTQGENELEVFTSPNIESTEGTIDTRHGNLRLKKISLHMGPDMLRKVRLSSGEKGMECLLVGHTREFIVKLLELLDITCDLTCLPQCSELLPRFFNLCVRFKLLHHCILILGPCVEDWPTA